MKARFGVIAMSIVMSVLLFGAVASAAAANVMELGFTKVVAEKKIKMGEVSQISHSGIKIDIPVGAFEHEVRFEVLEADTMMLQTKVAADQTVVMNFAFRVTDLVTNQLILKFQKPVMFSFKDKDINAWSVYQNVTLDGKVAPNDTSAVIDGCTLTHGVGGAPIGWLITTPTMSLMDDNS